MLPDQAAIGLAAEPFEMAVSHSLRIDEQVGSHAAQKMSPLVCRKSRARAELFKLTHDRSLTDKRRSQSADDLKQKIVSVLAFINFEISGKVSNERGAFGSVQQDDTTQAGLPFEPVYGDGPFLSRLSGLMQNYEIVQHGPILEIAHRRLSWFCHRPREFMDFQSWRLLLRVALPDDRLKSASRAISHAGNGLAWSSEQCR